TQIANWLRANWLPASWLAANWLTPVRWLDRCGLGPALPSSVHYSLSPRCKPRASSLSDDPSGTDWCRPLCKGPSAARGILLARSEPPSTDHRRELCRSWPATLRTGDRPNQQRC